MAGLLNPRMRSDVRNNSFGDYAGGLLSYAGNAVADRARGNIDKMLGDMRTMSSMNSQTTPEEAQAANNAMLDYVGAGTIGGRLAKTLNPKTLELAESMKKAGKNRDEIWKATGEATGQPAYFDPVDDSFRWEIDDSGMKMDAGGLSWGAKEDLRHGNPTTTAAMGDIMKHPELDAAYPGLLSFDDTGRRLTATMKKGDTGGSFSSQTGDVEFGIEAPRAVKNIDGELEFSPYFTESQKSTALHEVGGHGVQDIEGFARGGSPEQFEKGLRQKQAIARNTVNDANEQMGILSKKMDKLKEKRPLIGQDHDEMEWLKRQYERQLNRKLDDATSEAYMMDVGEEAHRKYKGLLGESDARAIQKRKDYSKQKRIDKPFWKDYDVPEDQLTRNYEVGKADSAPKGLLTEFEQAHAAAQKEAALPVSKGGLGLPANNTYIDRREAMTSGPRLFHGTDGNYRVIDEEMYGKNTGTAGATAFHMSAIPDVANDYAQLRAMTGQPTSIMPLRTLTPTRVAQTDKGTMAVNSLTGKIGQRRLADEISNVRDQGGQLLVIKNSDDSPVPGRDYTQVIATDPNLVRSEFAAFNPKKRNVRDILATYGGVGLLGLLGAEGREE